MNQIEIGSRKIGLGQHTYFVADVGANHDGSLERALLLIHLAKEAGADAAKFQNFKANQIVSDFGFRNLGHQKSHQSQWKKSVFEVYQDASISQDWTKRLKEECQRAGIDYFTSAYDYQSVDHVDPYVDLYKIGSGDITWIEMLEYIARKNKPVLVACGAADIGDVQRAVEAILKINPKVVLMQCNTNYTGSAENYDYLNLRVLETFRAMYPGMILGLSDHTRSNAPVLGAIALGAAVIERHFTDDNGREGPDHKFALNPEDWAHMVAETRILERSLGRPIKKVEPNEEDTVVLQQRCVRTTRPLSAGTVLSREDLQVLRPAPAGAIRPYQLDELLGKKALKDLPAGEALRLGDLS